MRGRSKGAGRRMLVFAHRGYSAKRPENTLPAFELAARAGADGIELDARFSGDGKVIVLHDDSLDRTTDGCGHPEEMSLRMIRKLDAGTWFQGKYGDTRVPTLREVVGKYAGRMLINVEIKPGRRKGLERAVVGVLRGHTGSCIVSSFVPTVLARCARLAPGFALGLLWEDGDWRSGVDLASKLGARYFNPCAKIADRELAGALRESGLKSIVFTVNSLREAHRLRYLGYDGIFTDDPGRLRGINH
jgi:glycerophosphoryl diester phosphodiesterase